MAERELHPEDAHQLREWFAGLADVTRLYILVELIEAGGELSGWDFALRLVRTTSEVNHHLRRLCESGLVVSRQEGRRRMYRLAGPWVAELLRAGREALPAKKQTSG